MPFNQVSTMLHMVYTDDVALHHSRRHPVAMCNCHAEPPLLRCADVGSKVLARVLYGCKSTVLWCRSNEAGKTIQNCECKLSVLLQHVH